MKLFAAVLLIALVAAAQGPTLTPETGVVLPADQALTFARPRLCNRPGAGRAEGTWTPDADTIQKLEGVLGRQLQAAIDLSSEQGRARLAADYYRQYAPLIIGGRQIIHVEGMYRTTVNRDSRFDWRTTAMLACDGGLLFFGTQYDVEARRLSRIIFNGGGRGIGPAERAGGLPSDVATLAGKAAPEARVYSWCRGDQGYAAALMLTRPPRYVFLHEDGRVETLATYQFQPDITCYSRSEAEKLNATIRDSETIEGSIKPLWDATVICGFVQPTEAVCWQYSPQERKFFRVGGWIT